MWTDFLRTNLTKFAVICVKRRQKAGFLRFPKKLQDLNNERKGKEKKRERGEEEKAMVALFT